MPEPQRLLDLLKAWRHSQNGEERQGIWEEMLHTNADQGYTIGIVNGTKQPVVVHDTLRNVPKEALYAFEPTAFFGLYMPDTFWFDTKAE